MVIREYGKENPKHLVFFQGSCEPWQEFLPAAEGLAKESLVCATDAGREGELIFRPVYHQCRCKKPFERLWISSMEDAAIREGKTTPPKRFTEDTMLSSMESAGAKEMPEDKVNSGKAGREGGLGRAERRGLGTPATRAATIEKLVQKGFLTRSGDKKTKYLVPTDRGISLITVMPELIQSPTLTADWEQKLVLIERGEYDPSAFMQEIEDIMRICKELKCDVGDIIEILPDDETGMEAQSWQSC